jgi:hypothetical protein
MDDRQLPLHGLPPRVIRASEFSRLGKSLLASAYERVVPIARVSLHSDGSPPWMFFRRQQMSRRKVGA